MIRNAFEQFNRYDRRIFWTLSALFTVSLAAYVYFLSISVVAVVERRTAESNLLKLNATISTLESKYAEMGRSIDLALAHERGFVDISVPLYITPDDTNAGFSLRTDHAVQ